MFTKESLPAPWKSKTIKSIVSPLELLVTNPYGNHSFCGKTIQNIVDFYFWGVNRFPEDLTSRFISAYWINLNYLVAVWKSFQEIFH